jgi:uncharacterized protein (TIGR00369 family)
LKQESELPSYTKYFVEKDKMGAHMGARFVSLSLQECVYEYEVSENHLNPNGILHGGALYTVMDSAQGMMVHAVLDDKYAGAATGTATIRYLAPVKTGTIRILTTIKEQSGRKIFVTSKAYNADQVLVADLEETWIAVNRPN